MYLLITKERFAQKPLNSALREPRERMREQSETHAVKQQYCLPQIACGLDKLEWPLVREIIQEIFASSKVRLTVYIHKTAALDYHEDDTNTNNEDSISDDEMRKTIRDAQESDESLKLVRAWVKRGRVPRNNDLQGSPELAWKLYGQFASLYLSQDVLCRRFEPLGGALPYLQQIVPPSLVDQVLTSLHSATTGGHLGTAKLLEKVKQRFWWPGFKDDVQLFIKCCLECQKRRNPAQTHRHSLVEWKPSYPFHHISLDFMGPLPTSRGNKVILLIGDHFTKWYEAVPLPDQRATTTASALIEHWISRFGCPHSIHSDQGRNFESRIFKELLRLLEIDKTRTTAFHPQSNSVIERMNRTLQNMLAKCVNEEQENWATQLPYVMMAYRSSIHESTGYSPQFLVQGRELTLPVDVMFPNPEKPSTSVDEFVQNRQKAFQRAFELVRANLNKNQKRRNALYNQRVHGPLYEDGQKVLLHSPAVPVGQTAKFSSPWRGPYVIVQCLNDVTYQIRELSTNKESVVHYDRLKPFFEKPATSNVPTRSTTIPQPAQPPIQSNVPTRNNKDDHTSNPQHDHSNCTFLTSGSVLTTPTAGFVPATATTACIPTPSTAASSGIPLTPTISSIPVPVTPPRPLTPSFLTPTTPSRSPVVPRQDVSTSRQSLIERAAENLRATAEHPYNLRTGTRHQRRAQPLHEASIPCDLRNYQSPRVTKNSTAPRQKKK